MSVELGGLEEIEGWTFPKERPLLLRILPGIATFARKKPLGFVSALVVVALLVVGDLVPTTMNAINDLFGRPLGESPIPFVADTVAPFRHDEINLSNRLDSCEVRGIPSFCPGRTNVLGTDSLGRDILSRLIYGARVSVMVPIGAVVIAETIAVMIAVASGYYGGWVDKLTLRLVDIFQALPALIVLITVLGIFGSGLWQLVIVIGVVLGPSTSRVIRSQVLTVMGSPYIESARVIGASDRRIMMRYVLPNTMAIIILSFTFHLGVVVLIEASLSFLGFGLPPPFPSWGQMLSLDGRDQMRSVPGLAIYPGLAIGLIVFSFNLLGDALRDTWDPRLRGAR